MSLRACVRSKSKPLLRFDRGKAFRDIIMRMAGVQAYIKRLKDQQELHRKASRSVSQDKV